MFGFFGFLGLCISHNVWGVDYVLGFWVLSIATAYVALTVTGD